jgi:glycine/D-amino acid oxidase-like deaminating enzyme
MTHTRTARVIGGGIAGPAAAIALQKVGIDPVVYEAHPLAPTASACSLPWPPTESTRCARSTWTGPPWLRGSPPRRSRSAATPASARFVSGHARLPGRW